MNGQFRIFSNVEHSVNWRGNEAVSWRIKSDTLGLVAMTYSNFFEPFQVKFLFKSKITFSAMDKFVIKTPKNTNLSLAETTQPGEQPNSQENVMEKSKKNSPEIESSD